MLLLIDGKEASFSIIKPKKSLTLDMAKKSLYTRALGIAVAKSAQSVNTGIYHVISGVTDNWVVVPKGSFHAVRAFSTKKDAVVFAKQTAARKKGAVIVHERTGQISNRFTFEKN
jgi:Uncharacterized protein conserved in bacteria (DUF2188)